MVPRERSTGEICLIVPNGKPPGPGDQDELKRRAHFVATGVYIQDPAVVAGARHFCGLGQATSSDGDVPGLGFDSRPLERPQTTACTD